MQEFIKQRGLTVCPPTGSKELAALNIEREKAYAKRSTRRWGTTGSK